MRYNLNIDKRLRFSNKALAETCHLPVNVTFSGIFTEASAKKFREELEAAENMAKDAGQEIIPIVIDSYGGVVYALASMIDAIDNCSLPVATIVEGKAMSCGAFLFACGAEGHRYVGPHATVMVHTAANQTQFEKIDELKASIEETERLNNMAFFEVLDKRCGHKSGYFLEQLMQRKMANWYMTPEECVEHNLANHIRIPEIKIDIKLETYFG